MGNDYHLVSYVLQIFPLFTKELAKQTFFNIVNIRGALTDVLILDACEVICNVPEGCGNGVLGGKQVIINEIGYFFSEILVFQKPQVNRKDVLDSFAFEIFFGMNVLEF
ncbi:MAG: hypothetical protein BWY69_01173 [Planctomycetes bacterium ADurb.Bin401]|nr:MAG: hypothetical protein BWY69_01173 [Planctomycetes bacterium ADurb.Bin401]